VDATIILIFFKTVFLVITFSLVHGIVFLPILLTVAMPNENEVEAAAENDEGIDQGNGQKQEEGNKERRIKQQDKMMPENVNIGDEAAGIGEPRMAKALTKCQ
jgi:hypothetical protein